MFISFFKDTGEITPPIMTSKESLTLNDVLGEEKGDIYSKIYDYINIVDDLEIYNNIRNYYVDVETKELKKKPEIIKEKSIMYL